MKSTHGAQLPKSLSGDSEGLPVGWVRAKLPDVTLINMGQSPPGKSYNSKGAGLPFFQGKADFGERYPSVRVWCSEPKKVAHAGDVLLSVRAPVGPTNLADRTCAIGRGLAAISPKDGIISEFIFFALRRLEQELALSGTGSTFTAISKRDIEGIVIDIPPLNEQKRIVAKIEELLPKVNSVRERLIRVKEMMKRFRQSVLSTSVPGVLLNKFEEANGANSDLKVAELSEIAESIQIEPFGSLLHRSDYIAGGIPAINPTNIKDGKIMPSPEVSISASKRFELERYILQEGDVIIGRRGEMGRCAVVGKNEAGWICGTGSLFIRAGADLIPEYLRLQISSPCGVAYLENASVGSTMTNLNQRIFREMPVAVPPVDEQRRIVRRVEALYKLADEVEKRIEVELSRTEKMSQTILAKAFRGELVE